MEGIVLAKKSQVAVKIANRPAATYDDRRTQRRAKIGSIQSWTRSLNATMSGNGIEGGVRRSNFMESDAV